MIHEYRQMIHKLLLLTLAGTRGYDQYHSDPAWGVCMHKGHYRHLEEKTP